MKSYTLLLCAILLLCVYFEKTCSSELRSFRFILKKDTLKNIYFKKDSGTSSVQSMYEPESYPLGEVNDFEEMGWGELEPILEDDSPVSALHYDDAFNVLWVGRQSGRVTANISVNMGYNTDRYSSFMSSSDPILEILSFDRSVITVSESQLKFHSYGGLPLSTIIPPYEDESVRFSCGHFLRDYEDLQYSAPWSIIAGTNGNFVNVFDAMRADAVLAYDVEVPTVRIQSNQLYVAVAGSDGMLRLLDGRLRTQHIIHTLPAHTCSITDMVLEENGYTLATCGMTGRAINPYDPKSPFIVSAIACTL